MSMDWDKLRIFHAVAEAGSFTHAGDVLNLSQSAVSRQISALEEALQVPLFHRHARGLILTEQGEAMNRTVREVFAKLAMTEALLTESKEKAAGRLKVTTTTGFGGEWLSPRLPGFLKAHPDITITLILEDGDLDLGMREADVAIRMHPPRQPDLVQRHLADIHMPVCAAASYLEAHGTPTTLEELDGHKLVLFGSYHPPSPDIDWLATSGKPQGQKRQPALEVNNLAAMADAIEAGLGIGSLPHYIVNERPALKKILTQVKAPIIEAYFVYPEELRTSKRVAVFRDFLLTEMPARS